METKNEIVLGGRVNNNYFPNPTKNVMILYLATSGSSSQTNYPSVAFYGE